MITYKKIMLPSADMFPLVKQLMAEGMHVRFTVSGSSMWPLIRHNTDSVLVTCPDKIVHVGDIVLAKVNETPAGYLLHRVVSLKDNSVITAGDNCLVLDNAILYECIIGKVEKIYRGSQIIDCSAFLWRLLFGIWRVLFHYREPLLNSLHFLARIKGKVYRIKMHLYNYSKRL
jgi:hypothetical protein